MCADSFGCYIGKYHGDSQCHADIVLEICQAYVFIAGEFNQTGMCKKPSSQFAFVAFSTTVQRLNSGKKEHFLSTAMSGLVTSVLPVCWLIGWIFGSMAEKKTTGKISKKHRGRTGNGPNRNPLNFKADPDKGTDPGIFITFIYKNSVS